MTSPDQPEEAPEEAPDRWMGGVRGTLDNDIGPAIEARLAGARQRSKVLDVALCVYERDRVAGGTLLGSALALRLFLLFLPLTLVFVGVAGVLGQQAGVNSVSESVGMSDWLSDEIDYAFDQSASSMWAALFFGLIFAGWAGRSLSRALVLSSALSWQMGGRQKTPLRVTGIVIGVMVGMALAAALLNRLRVSTGFAVTSVSFAAVAVAYLVTWFVAFLALPRETHDPGATIPGAALVAALLTGLHAISLLYLPEKIANASALYGAIGIALAFLGWFFIIGRSVAFALALNAVVYEQVGSVSQFVFSLPGVRVLPRRFDWLARFFDLDVARNADEQPESPDPASP